MDTPTSHTPIGSNPFSTPAMSINYSSPQSLHSAVPRRRFRSSRLIGAYEQPWTGKKEPRKIWDPVLFYGGIFLGLAVSAYICYTEIVKVPQWDYCLVLEDNFETLDLSTWNHEVQLDGFGTSSFDWTTDDSANTYVDGEGLHIMPTLTTESTNITADQLYNGYSLNLTADGTCMSTFHRKTSPIQQIYVLIFYLKRGK